MTHGSMGDKLIMFALPVAATALLEQLFNAADIAVLGRYVGTSAVAAVGNNFAIIGMYICLFIGLSLGSNVVIAKLLGAKQISSVKEAVHTSLVVGCIVGVMMCIVGQLVTPYVLQWLSVPTDVLKDAETYMRVYLWGMPFISIYNFGTAVFRSNGNTKTPLIGLVLASIVNVVLNIVFVTTMTDGVAGVALATVISFVVAATYVLGRLYQSNETIAFRWRLLGINWSLLQPIVRIGVPAGLQGVVFCLSNILIQEAINSLGPDVMAASSISIAIEMFIFCIIMAFSQGGTTFISQNFGAKHIRRCIRVTVWSLGLAFFFTIIACGLVMIWAADIAGFFNPDPTVIALCVLRMTYVVALEPLQVLIDVLAGAMRGYGLSLAPAMLTLLGICGVRIIWVYTVFQRDPSFELLMMVYPISWAVAGGLLILLYMYFTRHLLTFLQRNR